MLGALDRAGVPRVEVLPGGEAPRVLQFKSEEDEAKGTIADIQRQLQKPGISPSDFAILFRTNDGASYQVKGPLAYHTAGPAYDFMKSWNPAKHPGHAATVLTVTEAYSGAERLL